MHRVSKLKNGLRLISVPSAATKAVTVLALFPVGSRYEREKIAGASHFVEHMLFKGTERRPSYLDISLELDAAGAEYNAFTAKDHTGYYIKIDGARAELAFDLLSDMLFRSRFDESEVAKEKGVIVEEIRMYDDNPTMDIENLFDQVMFGKCPLGRDVAGTAKTVRTISRFDLYDYYRRAYRPENMVLAVAGRIGENSLKKWRRYFENCNSNPASAQNRSISRDDYQKFFWDKKEKKLSDRVAVKEKPTDQSHLILGFPGLPHNHPDRFALSVLLNILGGTMSSRLFVEVREKRGLAYMVRAGGQAYRDAGVVQIQAGLDPGRLSEALKVIKTEVKRIAEEKVTADELSDAKNNFAGRTVLALEDSSAQADWFAKQFLFNKQMETYEDVLKKIKKVTAADVLRVAKRLLVWKKVRLAVIGPVKKTEVIKML